MIYVLSTLDYIHIDKLIYVSNDIKKVFNILNNEELKSLMSSKYDFDRIIKKMQIDEFEINKVQSRWYSDKNNYDVDLVKKLVTKDNNIVYNFNDDKLNKREEKQKLLNKCRDLMYKKDIPKKRNNYYEIISEIEKNNNIDEDIDYLVSVLIELESYEDKEKS